MYYVNMLNIMDDTGTLEGCKDLHLTLERELQMFECTEIDSQ